MAADIGQVAPDFILKGTDDKEYSLNNFKGQKNVLLVFYPLAFTPVWSRELPALEKDLSRFAGLNTQVLGVSVDSLPTNKTFAEKVGVKSFPLLSDLKKEVAQKYGVLREEGFSERCTFLIDKEGIIRWKQVQRQLSDQRNNDELLAAVRGVVAG